MVRSRVIALERPTSQDHAILADCRRFYQTSSFTDVVFHVGGAHIRAHSIILASVSPWFKQLRGPTPETTSRHPEFLGWDIILDGYSLAALQTLMNLVYSGKVRGSSALLSDTLQLAKALEINLDLDGLGPFQANLLAEAINSNINQFSTAPSKEPIAIPNRIAEAMAACDADSLNGARETAIKPSNLKIDLGNAVQCSQCPFQASSVWCLRGHLVGHFQDELLRQYGDADRSCNICGKGFDRAQHLARHIGEGHGKVKEFLTPKEQPELHHLTLKPAKSTPASLELKCSQCGTTVKHSVALRTHIIGHFQDQILARYPYSLTHCEVCSKAFDCPSDMARHLAQDHIKLGDFISPLDQPELFPTQTLLPPAWVRSSGLEPIGPNLRPIAIFASSAMFAF